jgi:hypothetical protein
MRAWIRVKFALFVCIQMAALAACVSTRQGAARDFVRRWQAINPGMTVEEVRTRLGMPDASYIIPTDGTRRIEYWIFTDTNWASIPPPEAYVIYYDSGGRVSTVVSP